MWSILSLRVCHTHHRHIIDDLSCHCVCVMMCVWLRVYYDVCDCVCVLIVIACVL